jgi:DNA-binding NarL/FixJ family response regulator
MNFVTACAQMNSKTLKPVQRETSEVKLKPRVLLADDHRGMLDRATSILSERFEVSAVLNGQEMLEAAMQADPDVVVLDISMPVLDGLQAALELRRLGSRAKVIFLTMHEGDDYVNAAMACGAQGYVLKRRMLSDLQLAIEEVFAGRVFISPQAPSLHTH